MRWSKLFTPTLRDAPADAEAASHALLVKGGFIRQLHAGHYSLLPLGQRVAENVTRIIREEMERIGAALDTCDLFLSIGTSGNVYPAAGFVADVRQRGQAHTVEINLEPSQGHSLFAETVYGRAAEVLPPYVEDLLA